jgi:hypothetical protein
MMTGGTLITRELSTYQSPSITLVHHFDQPLERHNSVVKEVVPCGNSGIITHPAMSSTALSISQTAIRIVSTRQINSNHQLSRSASK